MELLLMKIYLLFILILSYSCAHNSKGPVREIKENLKTEGWRTTGFMGPESAYFDPATQLIFVSNVAGLPLAKDKKGWISILSAKGKLLNSKWVGGLNAPKGLRSRGDSLWVSDIDRVVEISINSGRIINKYEVAGAEFLNDLAIDEVGSVYISDMFTGKVHKISNGKISTILTKEDIGQYPNGLFYQDGQLYIAGWGKNINKKTFATDQLGSLLKVNLRNMKITQITGPLGYLDGLEKTSDSNWLVSDWVNGKVFKVTQAGAVSLLYKGKQGTADIGYIPGKENLLVPLMNENQTISIPLR